RGRGVTGILAKVDDAVGKVERGLVTAALVGMVALVFVQVVLRYVFNTGLPWLEETARYLLIWTGFLGASIATKDRRHIAIDALPRAFNPDSRAVALLGTLNNLICAGFCAFLVWIGWDFAGRSMELGRVSTTLEMPLWIVQGAIPFACAIMTLRFLGFAFGEFLILIGVRERRAHGVAEGLGDLLKRAEDGPDEDGGGR
ncbi:MAG: TRAP transporter small permease, partial [Candidatus Methylomirabilis sp.]|nr:TRAP transporter small permease [Deltaproteobacteria bacterium]